MDAETTQPSDDEISEIWTALLTGQHPGLRRFRKVWGVLPTDPRCKLCNAPFHGLGGFVAKATKRGPGRMNANMCRFCEDMARDNPGGAVVLMTMGFADVRGSTDLSTRMSDTAFAKLVQGFFKTATEVLSDGGAFIDKLVGDAANGYFLPAFAGEDHANVAIDAFTDLLRRTGHGSGEEPPLPIGAGVHTGEAYFGSVGAEGALSDFTALGEQVNFAARLGAHADAGEILISDEALTTCTRPVEVAERRALDLKGFAEPVEVNVVRVR